MSVKLKVLRTQARLTLEELAQRADLTRSYISKLERGLSAPSVAVGLRIAKVLGVGVEELFSNSSHDDVVIVKRAPSNKADGTWPPLPRVVSALPGHKLVAFVLNPTDKPGKNHPMSHHGGEELLYVLKGRIRLQLAQREEILHAGDCAHFNSTIPHKITSIGKQQASVLLIATQD